MRTFHGPRSFHSACSGVYVDVEVDTPTTRHSSLGFVVGLVVGLFVGLDLSGALTSALEGSSLAALRSELKQYLRSSRHSPPISQ